MKLTVAKKRHTIPGIASALLMMTSASLCQLAQAKVEGEVLIGYEVGYDDNINRGFGDDDREEDITNLIYTDIDLFKQDGFLRYDAYGRLGFEMHSSDLTDDQFYSIGGFNGAALIIPNRFVWNLTDVASLRRIDARGFDASANLEKTNFLRTGPTFYFRPGDQTFVELSGYYQNSWFEFGNDSQYYGADLATTYRFSELSELVVTVSQVQFIPDGDRSDQTQRSANARFLKRIQRGQWFIGGGASQIVVDQDSAIDNEDIVPTYEAGFTYLLLPKVTLDLRGTKSVFTIGEQDLQDSSRGTLVEQFTTDSALPTGVDQAALEEELQEFTFSSGFNIQERAEAALIWQDGRWSAALTGFVDRIQVPEFQFDLSPLARDLVFAAEGDIIDADQQTIGVELAVGFEPKLRWFSEVAIRSEERELSRVDIGDGGSGTLTTDAESLDITEHTFRASLNYAAGRYLSFGTRVELVMLEEEGRRSDPARSNRIFFNVEYSL